MLWDDITAVYRRLVKCFRVFDYVVAEIVSCGFYISDPYAMCFVEHYILLPIYYELICNQYSFHFLFRVPGTPLSVHLHFIWQSFLILHSQNWFVDQIILLLLVSSPMAHSWVTLGRKIFQMIYLFEVT